jgi:hypothetical protein
MNTTADALNRMRAAALIAALLLIPRPVLGQQVTVVNMIPNSLSGETNRDAEPNLSVNPAKPNEIVGSAFTPDLIGASNNIPLFISTDGGLHWDLSPAVIAGTPGSCFTAVCDITLRFARTSNLLYVSDLNPVAGISRLDIWSVANPTTAATATLLQSRPGNASGFADQPYIEASSATGRDRVFVGDNDLMAAGGRTATIDHTANATPPPPSGFTNTVLETRATSGQDSPSVRPAVHRDGTVYGLYAGFRAGGTEVVVVRDDNWGIGGTPFRALIDGDGQPGIRVVSGLTGTTSVGSQRVGQGLAIAVDPNNSQNVYIVYGEGSTAATYTLHVRNSTNRGAAWSGDLFTVASATNPGIAVTSMGEVGFLYQQFNSGRFETHLIRTSNNFGNTSDLLLANVPDNAGGYTGANPIGDYASLQAVDTDFYGIFSANNTPAAANFFPGTIFLRNHNFATQTLTDLANNPVAVSIDPFFFHVACCAPKIQIPGPVAFADTCLGSSADAVANVCNTGKKDLIVNAITSSNAQFSVTTPSSGYPVTIAPGTCFPFQVQFTPTSTGLQTGTLTIPSNDPVTPSAQLAVSGTGGSAVIATMVVDTGNFGRVCQGTFRDKVVTIANSGICPLRITGITSSSPEFQTPQVLSFPLVIAPGTSIEVPIRLQPTSPGAKSATITISSSDATTPVKLVNLTGETPEEWVCHPPTFASLSMSGGPAFGHTRSSDFTFSGQGRALVPFGPAHSFGLQTQGEFIGYHERDEGELDAGLMNRWKWLQGGVFANIKAAELGAAGDAGVLGHASFTLDVLLKTFRINVFGAKGFHDDALLRVVDQFGGGAQVNLAPWLPKTYLEGNLVYLHQPEPLGGRPGAMLRVSHQLFERLELTAEVTVNESLVGPTNNGRVVFGFVFGRWARPQDLSNRGTPLGTDAPRVHYVVR